MSEEAFTLARPRLLGLAYRMLGSWAEAEDILQDAWLRYSSSDTSKITNLPAWLTRVVTNLCLDVMKSSRAKRETYVGPWLPEPILTQEGLLAGEAVDPKGLSLAFLCLLERLSPLERAVYILAEAFEYTHDEIASLLEREPAAIRQLLHRARAHVREGNIRFAPDKEAHSRMLEAFSMACLTGDSEALGRLLASDIIVRNDGGGRAQAALRPIYGADRAARFLLGVRRKAAFAFAPMLQEINGWPCVVLYVDERPYLVFDIETDGAKIFSIQMIVNPDKLGFISP